MLALDIDRLRAIKSLPSLVNYLCEKLYLPAMGFGHIWVSKPEACR
jgi:hypothetical protein